jgi:hypothetical protein
MSNNNDDRLGKYPGYIIKPWNHQLPWTKNALHLGRILDRVSVGRAYVGTDARVTRVGTPGQHPNLRGKPGKAKSCDLIGWKGFGGIALLIP